MKSFRQQTYTRLPANYSNNINIINLATKTGYQVHVLRPHDMDCALSGDTVNTSVGITPSTTVSMPAKARFAKPEQLGYYLFGALILLLRR